MHAGTCLVSELFILWLSLQRVKVLLFEKNIYYWKVFFHRLMVGDCMWLAECFSFFFFFSFNFVNDANDGV